MLWYWFAKKVPAIPAILVGIILGFLSQVFIQGGSVSASVGALQAGFVIDTGNKLVDELFNRGGLDSMMNTVSMTIVAMTFGGVLEHTGILRSIVNQILKLATSAKGLSLLLSHLALQQTLLALNNIFQLSSLQECTQMHTRKKDYIQKTYPEH